MFLNFSKIAQCQHKSTTDRDITSLTILNPEKNDGFGIKISLVAMFTAGVADRSGFRLGGGISVSQQIGDWSLVAGLDAYKANNVFGLATTYAGLVYDDNKYGGSYYVNRYYQGDSQISGILGIHLDEFNIRFEDDILALPFTNFTLYDRYRTAALEVQFKGFVIGTNVYTNEADGLTDMSLDNAKGVYANGKQISSPVYVGYTRNNLILRYGLNSKLGGYLGQNWWHQSFFDTTDFKTGDFKNSFIQIGVDKPYTLY